ncbi:stage II sporulation protein M [Terrisporobacter sp.]|uniref:stage II sporulation protein M n=1 Tax=Terrisporobacter sp. TaxID=1965305 RepID=UPI00260B396E|nr:stage II sporulation protein M [Terrisporobacter sp.]
MYNNISKDIKKGFIIINCIYATCFLLGIFFSLYIGVKDGGEKIFNQQNIQLLEKEYIFLEVLNNNLKLGIKILSGVIFGGISSIGFICLNGIFFGIVCGVTIKTYSFLYLFKLVAFHGGLEIIAFNILAAASIIPIIFIKNKILNKEYKILENIKIYFKLGILGISLIIIAAFIEGFISTIMI